VVGGTYYESRWKNHDGLGIRMLADPAMVHMAIQVCETFVGLVRDRMVSGSILGDGTMGMAPPNALFGHCVFSLGSYLPHEAFFQAQAFVWGFTLTRLRTFENHLRNRLLSSVRERKRDMDCSQLRRKLSGLTVENDRGPSPGLTRHFNITPAHAATPSRSQRFHSGFLGGKTSGVALNAIGFGIAVADLSFGKHALKKAVAMPRNGLRDTRDLRNVDAGANNHERLR
jgi:hypothetical protein